MSDINAPGCFGSVLSFSSTDKTCAMCKYNQVCEEKAYESLLEMRQTVDVSEFEQKFNIHRIKTGKRIVNEAVQQSDKRKSRSKMTDEQRAIVDDDSLPVKPRKLLGSIFRKGFDAEYLLGAIRTGINPFRDKKPAILEKVFDLLLDGGFTKSDLHKTYLAGGMAKRTAHSQVSVVVAALALLEVTNENKQSGKITIKGEQ